MITVSYNGDSVEIRSIANIDDERNYDQSMIVRRSRAGNLIAYRDTEWHDFDIITVRSKTNIKANIDDLDALLEDAWGSVISVEIEHTDDTTNSIHKLFTGVVITPLVEIVTMQDECSYDISFELIIVSETNL